MAIKYKHCLCLAEERDVAHGAMGRWVDASCWTYSAISHSNQCSTTGRGMCYPVCGMMHIKQPLLLIG